MTDIFVYGAAVSCLSLILVGAGRPTPVGKLIDRVDDVLLSRVSLALFVPSRDPGAAVWEAIGGWLRLGHFIRQMCIVAKAIVEIRKKVGPKSEVPLEVGMEELWSALRMTCAERILAFRCNQHPEAIRLGKAATHLANLYAKALNAVDSVQVNAV